MVPLFPWVEAADFSLQILFIDVVVEFVNGQFAVGLGLLHVSVDVLSHLKSYRGVVSEVRGVSRILGFETTLD